MRSLAQRLIHAENRLETPHNLGGQAAFRVCERLREVLSTLVGTRGFKALIIRAHALAKKEVSWLEKVTIDPNGIVALPPEVEREIGTKEAVRGGTILVNQLLELLETLLGESLTQNLIERSWPNEKPGPLKSKE